MLTETSLDTKDQGPKDQDNIEQAAKGPKQMLDNPKQIYTSKFSIFITLSIHYTICSSLIEYAINYTLLCVKKPSHLSTNSWLLDCMSVHLPMTLSRFRFIAGVLRAIPETDHGFSDLDHKYTKKCRLCCRFTSPSYQVG